MPPLKLHEVASIEAFQEAGVSGEIHKTGIGSYLHSKTPSVSGCRPEVVEVAVFPLEVHSTDADWPEMETRERLWFQYHRAIEVVGAGQLRELLEAFADEFVFEAN